MFERMGLVLVALAVLAGIGVAVATDPSAGRGLEASAAGPETASPSPSPTPTPVTGDPAPWVVSGPGGTPLWTEAGGVVDEVAAPGLTWPIVAEEDGGYVVETHCDRPAWVAAGDVVRPLVDRIGDVAGAVVVVDAGHGGIDAGAVGPGGLAEKDVNLAVATRLQALLERANDVDQGSGGVTPGDQWPAVGAVVMTRDATDGVAGDQQTSLSFRGRLAALTETDVLVSIHHNASDTRTFDEPPVEILFSVAGEESPRLAGLVLEELRRSLAPFADTWRGTTSRGTIGRADPDGTNYYTVLQEAKVPAVIAEGLYLSTEAGEALAGSDAVQQAYAEGLYRALVRFLGTDDTGTEVNDPVTFDPGGASPYDFSTCSMAAPEATASPSPSAG